MFLAKKNWGLRVSLGTAYAAVTKCCECVSSDKLVKDINTLNSRRQAIKAKVAVAKTQDKINKLGASADKLEGSMGAFERMEAKADKMLDQANAMAELDSQPADPVQSLEEKYKVADVNASVEDELAALKKQLGL